MAPKPKKTAPKRAKKQATTTGPRYARRQPSSSSTPTVSLPSSHHIRPPPINTGNPSMHTLLLDDRARARYLGFQDKSFVPIYRLTSSFLASLCLDKLHELLSVQPMTKFILDNTDSVFPGMVGQFFANLTFESPSARNVIISQVNRVPIRLDWHALNTIYETALPDPNATLHYWDDTHMWPETSARFKISELRQMFNVSSREAKDFNPSNLDPADRVIYHLLVNFINPVAGHFTNPGKVPLVYYYLFTHQIPIDWGFAVFNRLADCITDHRRNLPHAPFLTPIFRHFKIPFNESGVLPPTFDMGTLTKKGIRLHEGNWVTRQTYHSLSKPPSSVPHGSSDPAPSQSASSSLDARIDLLQQSVNTLLQHVRYLEHGVAMALPGPLREEFKSDRIIFGLSSNDSDSDSPAAATGDIDDDSSDTDDDDGDSSADDGSNDDSESDTTAGDVPLIRHFKKTKPAP